LVGALLERENLLSTALEGGIALLHTRARPAIPSRRSFLLLGRSVVGLDFQAPDGKKTHLFFLLGLRTDRLHLATLARLQRLFRDQAVKEHLLAAASAGEIRGILGAAEARLLERE
jgi:PTS system nitrogen regulatory IIA component